MITQFQPHIVLGLGDGSIIDIIPPDRRVCLIMFPGEQGEPPAREGLTFVRAETVASAMNWIRRQFASHAQIVTLASTLVLADHELSPEAEKHRAAWSPEIVKRICLYFEDLGNDPRDTWTGVRHSIIHGPLLQTAPTTDDLLMHYKGLPAICLGAGPSAAEPGIMDSIAAAQGKAVILATDAMLRPLRARGINPDFVVAIERIEATADMLDGLGGGGATLIAPPPIAPRAVAAMERDVLWYWRPDNLERWLCPYAVGRNTGNSCGTLGVAAAIIAGCDPIYLIGHDLCMADDGRTHSDDADPAAKSLATMLGSTPYYTPEDEVAIDGRPVRTTPLWRLFRADLEHFMQSTVDVCTVVNCSNGLDIRGTKVGPFPTTWPATAVPPKPTRDLVRPLPKNPREFLDTLRLDCGQIVQAVRALEETGIADPDALLLPKLVDPSTLVLWRDITRSLYHSTLLRLHLRPEEGPEFAGRARAHMATALKASAQLILDEINALRL